MIEAGARSRGYAVGEISYGAEVELELLLTAEQVGAARALAAELSAGAVELRLGDEVLVDLPA